MEFPDWLIDLDPDVVIDAFLPIDLERGAQYAAQGRVEWVAGNSFSVQARVQGSGYRVYQVMLILTRGRFATSCTCPVQAFCKHCAAVVIMAQRGEPSQPKAPQWQQVLMPIAELDKVESVGSPLALQVSYEQGRVGLRVMGQGKTGKWIKSAADWDRVRYPFSRDYDERQRKALLDVYSTRETNAYYTYRVPTVVYLDELNATVWPALREVVNAGVRLFPPPGIDQVTIAEQPASLDVNVQPGPDGGLTISTVVRVGDREIRPNRWDLIGRTPHGISYQEQDSLLLAALPRVLDAAEVDLIVQSSELSVPADDVALFSSSYLPTLRRRMKVNADAVVLPEVQPPQLVVRVAIDNKRALLTWGFRYRVGHRDRDTYIFPDPDMPFRDYQAERALMASVDDGPWLYDIGLGPTVADVRISGRQLIDFASITLPRWHERDDIVVELIGTPLDYRQSAAAPVVRLGVQPPDAGHWFGLDVEVSIDDEPVPFADLFTALTRRQHELVLDSGLWFSLDRPELQSLKDLIGEASSLTDRPPGQLRLRPEHAGLWEELVALGVVAEQSAAWRESIEALLSLEDLPETPVPDGINATLRGYQLTGFRWLNFLWRTGLGGILADEMGLGKTLQAITWLAATKQADELTAPVLVVAPTSVIGTWVREAATFAPGLKVVALTETTRKRGASLAEAIADADVVVTSYTLVRLDDDEFVAQPWAAVLLDEAQFVKNRQSQSYKVIRRLNARMKVALTGTPLENNLMDLWSMLSITAPGLFSDPKVFTDLYRRPIESGDAAVLHRLQRRIRPLILRRTKQAVAAELPPKQEQVIEVELSSTHRRLYDRQLQRERQKVLRLIDDLDRNRLSVLRSLTLLRQLALSPALIDDSHQAQSAKIDELVARIHELAAEGHRALVFSQFTSFLSMVRDRLAAEGIAASYLDGRTRDRGRRIEEFRNGDQPVFLISLKAGGFGLTLIEADYVFILDPWWNPAAENQAIDRTHRIGQTAHVMVYRLVSADTIEGKVLELQRSKRDLFDRVVGDDADLAAPLSADDIRGLLSE